MFRSPPKDLLGHILKEAKFLSRASENMTEESFLHDEMAQRAFVRSLEIIGEATQKLDATFRRAHPTVEWREIAGTRDKLIHDYVEVDYFLVWDIVRNEIPTLTTAVEEILTQL